MKRYTMISGSESGHCCFEWTVIDRAKVEYVNRAGEITYATVCETFTKSEASRICEALNQLKGELKNDAYSRDA